jgi:hypothetical protein
MQCRLIASETSFSTENRAFEAMYPLAYADFPEHIAAKAEVEKFAESFVGGKPQDIVVDGRADWERACKERHGAIVQFENHTREAYGKGCSAWKVNVHVGEFREDTARGTVFA